MTSPLTTPSTTTGTTAATTALVVRGLRVDVVDSPVNLVADINLSLAPGEIMGLVGESGSGKTTTALALLGYAKLGTHISEGTVEIAGADLLAASAHEIRKQRGRLISYVPQDPVASLNPSMRIGAQLEEAAAKLLGLAKGELASRVAQSLTDVALPNDAAFLRRFPHQLSGGQQQRVGLAMAFIGEPAVVVLDEPTTGLDVSTQARVLETVRGLCDRHGTAAVYVSHDLAVVSQLADSVSVMYLGRLVETGPTAEVLSEPSHPYTRLLVAAIPDPRERRKVRGIPGHAPSVLARGEGCVFASRCPLATDVCRAEAPLLLPSGRHGQLAACWRIDEVAGQARAVVELEPMPVEAPAATVLQVSGLHVNYGSSRVIEDFALSVPRGSCTAIVGESGSGKTTLAKTLGGLHSDAEGDIVLDGELLRFGARHRTLEQRRQVQYVFQNPYSSLNPRRTVQQLIEQSLKAFAGSDAPERRVDELLELVSLNPRLMGRYPQQLSGGERQRVAIARAIAVSPSVLICDEITSALDVSVQASIVALLKDLHQRSGTTILFITHNIAVVRAIADHVAVLRGGVLIEQGPAEEVLDRPTTEYMTNLMESTPRLSAVTEQ